jgi:CHAT domain-containing protein
MREFYRLREANPAWSKAEALRQAQLELLTGQTSAAVATNTERSNIRVTTVSSTGSTQPRYTEDPKAPLAHPYYWAPFILIGNWK